MAKVKCIEIFYHADPDNGITAGIHRVPVYPQCRYFNAKGDDKDDCIHPDCYWHRCSTAHMLPIDEHSCPFDIHKELHGDIE